MARDSEQYDYRHLVGGSASDSDKEFDASHFDELLTDDDRRLLQCDMCISWWAYSDISMRPFSQA